VVTPIVADSGSEIVITFEDLYEQDQAMGPVPSGYRGFTWSDSAWFMTREFSSSVCPGVRVGLLNAHGKDITIGSNHPFDLKGLSLCTLWAYNARVRVEGWEKKVIKYTTTQTVSRGSTTHCALDYRGVDRVELKVGGTHLVITAITVLFT
jgi:hypothetical protein